jgi:hypothetical protein
MVSQNILRRRDTVDFGQMIDEGTHELGPSRPLFDEARELLVLWLSPGLLCNDSCAGKNQRKAAETDN